MDNCQPTCLLSTKLARVLVSLAYVSHLFDAKFFSKVFMYELMCRYIIRRHNFAGP